MTDSNPAVFDPAALGSTGLRVGTAEREKAAAALGEHFAAGRLEVDEYDERVARAFSAKTTGDLVVLFTDLPRPAPPTAPRVRRGDRGVLQVAAIVAFVAAVALVVTTHIFPFFLFPVLFLVIVRARRGWGPGYRRRYYRM
ncbi:DUF1707 domain-containing protein [Nocardia sp. NEAU-G5]|uniref:DUF1707 domain-containing protein n=1 Tax=Nocardia albiluteola TaxID=2842303 RepID=A0ABS6B6P1_9NOCA|nr:DUF1707 domain-containing protein [Nocardia albiluteola]MBU3065066.1 DUF1707 domain-containing protein [Nocardia albiluteola]